MVGVLLLLIGCNSSGSFNKNTQTILPLSVGEELEVLSGDTISPADEQTRIELRHVLGTDKKFVTLVSGTAELIRGSYVSN